MRSEFTLVWADFTVFMARVPVQCVEAAFTISDSRSSLHYFFLRLSQVRVVFPMLFFALRGLLLPS